MHFNKINFLHLNNFKVLTASLISDNLAIPVDIMTGFPVLATLFIKGISTISNEDIL